MRPRTCSIDEIARTEEMENRGAAQVWAGCRTMAPVADGIILKRVALIRMVINDPASVAL